MGLYVLQGVLLQQLLTSGERSRSLLVGNRNGAIEFWLHIEAAGEAQNNATTYCGMVVPTCRTLRVGSNTLFFLPSILRHNTRSVC